MRSGAARWILLSCMTGTVAPRAAGQSLPVVAQSCPEHVSFEDEHYRIRHASVEDPFSFLRWIRAEVQYADHAVSFLDGQPFTLAAVRAGGDALDQFAFVNPSGEGITVNVTVVTAENCHDQALDLIYRVYNTRVQPTLTVTRERRAAEQTSPQNSAGTAKPTLFGVQPLWGYDRSNGAFGGARMDAHLPTPMVGIVDHMLAEGWASGSTFQASSALAGSYASASSWLQHAAWRFDYLQAKRATGTGRLQEGTLAAQFSGTSRPIGTSGVALRFGGRLQGGSLHSNFDSAALASNTIQGSGYGSLKLYGGATGRTRHQSFAATYGLELGERSSLNGLDWRKHIGDAAYEFWLPRGDHRLLEVEQRFTVGALQIPGTIPVAARFFGGNQEQDFIAGDTWRVRANPVIRSIPANRLYQTADGAGADRFTAYNLTAAYTVWRKPLIPNSILKDADFLKRVHSGVTDATSALTVTYLAKDSHFLKSLSHLSDLRASLDRVQQRVVADEAAHPGQSPDAFRLCKSALTRAKQRATSAASSKPPEAYGLLAALLTSPTSEDENRLKKVNEACFQTLNANLEDAALRAEGETLIAMTSTMQTEFDQVDQTHANDQAQEEMRYAKTTLDTLLNDTNLVSLSAAGIFDFAHIGPAGGTRFGLGVGLRLTLVSSVSVTGGYAWGIRRPTGDDRGALFFEMKFRDLFQ